MLADEADASRAGRGRLVMLAGEAGAGKTSLVRRSATGGSSRASSGARATRCSRRGRSGRCWISPTRWAASSGAIRGDAGPHEIVSALLRAVFAPARDRGARGRALGGRGDARVLRLLARKVEASAALVLVTYRDDEVDRTTRCGSCSARSRPRRRHATPIGRCRAPPWPTGASAEVDAEELLPPDRWQPVLRHEVLAAGDGARSPTIRDAVLARAAR